MVNEKAGLTELPRSKRYSGYHERWFFSEGAVRKAFQKVYSPEKDFVLFKTIANKQAVEALKQYIGFRKSMSSPWDIRMIREGDKPRYVPGSSDQGNGLQFDNNLMDSYLCAIDKIGNKKLGEKEFSRYSMVSTYGVHGNDKDPKAIFWPIIYIVNADKEDGLKGIIDDLLSDESLEVLRGIESPQFYHMGEIDTLHKLGIAPIIRLPQELRVGAQDLSSYIDFLTQMTEVYEWTGPVYEID